MNSNQFLAMYQELSEESKAKIFTEEQRATIDKQLSFLKMFNDPSFYKVVERAVAEEVCEKLKGEQNHDNH